MDAKTKKARELVTVELTSPKFGVSYWDGLTWNVDQAQAHYLERGRAEILISQQRRRLFDELQLPVELRILEAPTQEIAELADVAATRRNLTRILGAR